MKKVVSYKKKALAQYEDLRDTVSVIEAMIVQGARPGVSWDALQKKLHSKDN